MHKDNKKHYIQTLLAFFLHQFSKKISFLAKNSKKKHRPEAIKQHPNRPEPHYTPAGTPIYIYSHARNKDTNKEE